MLTRMLQVAIGCTCCHQRSDATWGQGPTLGLHVCNICETDLPDRYVTYTLNCVATPAHMCCIHGPPRWGPAPAQHRCTGCTWQNGYLREYLFSCKQAPKVWNTFLHFLALLSHKMSAVSMVLHWSRANCLYQNLELTRSLFAT